MILRQRCVRAAVLLCVLAASVVPIVTASTPAAAAGTNPYVKIVLNKEKKQIEISATLVLLSAPGASEKAMNQLAAEVKKQIESTWSGTNFKCWKVVTTVDVKVRMVDHSSSTPVDPNVIEIQVVRTPNPAVPGRSYIMTKGNADARSDSPADFHPALAQGATFYDNGPNWQVAWAHEFGHILGLDDSYEEFAPGKFRTKDGLSNDVMSLEINGLAVPATITRVLRRNGVDVSDVKCPMSMNTDKGTVFALGFGTGEFALHAFVCDYPPDSTDPKNIPKITFEGVLTIKGTVTQGQADAANNAVNFVTAAASVVGIPVPATPHFNPDTGATDYQVSFTTSGLPYEEVTINGAPLDLKYLFGWQYNGLLRDARPGATLQGVPGDAYSPIVNLKMSARFTEGAKECS